MARKWWTLLAVCTGIFMLLLDLTFVLVGAGLMLMRGITPASGWSHLLAGMIMAGAGAGFVNVPLAATAVGVVAPARAGMASGINTTFRQVGTATGVAALGSIFASHIRTAHAGLAGFVGGLNLILLIGAGVAFTAAAITLITVRERDLVQPLTGDGRAEQPSTEPEARAAAPRAAAA